MYKGRIIKSTEQPTNWGGIELQCRKLAYVYQRLSTHEQVEKNRFSLEKQNHLVGLAKEYGYPDNLIHVEKRDLGISGTKTDDERPGLAHLIEMVKAGKVESVFVVDVSRLYRDQTMINALVLGELFKANGIIIITPYMAFDLRQKMHMKMYRMEVDRAADELDVMSWRMHGAQTTKARAGYYAGEPLPTGYVVDERKTIDGYPNPDYHTLQIFEPHAAVIRFIFKALLTNGPTATARLCQRQNVVFEALPPHLDTGANNKARNRSQRNPDGSWPVTVDMVRSIGTNPAYIGWKIWKKELVGTDVYPLIVDEAIFEAVQQRIDNPIPTPRAEYDPLPLAALARCGKCGLVMVYSNYKNPAHSRYTCDCFQVTASIIDEPLAEAVLSQLPLGEMAETVWEQIGDEHRQNQAQIVAWQKEQRQVYAEIANIEENLDNAVAGGRVSENVLLRLDEQIKKRQTRLDELADLIREARQHKPVSDTIDLSDVRRELETLYQSWPVQPNGLKNIFLSLLLRAVRVEPLSGGKFEVLFTWRSNVHQMIRIQKPYRGPRKKQAWTEAEIELLRQHYPTADQDDLVALFPNRHWPSIYAKARLLGIKREVKPRLLKSKPFSTAEDAIVRRYYAGAINADEALDGLNNRSLMSIYSRARKLGLGERDHSATWAWVTDVVTSRDGLRLTPPDAYTIDVKTVAALGVLLSKKADA